MALNKIPKKEMAGLLGREKEMRQDRASELKRDAGKAAVRAASGGPIAKDSAKRIAGAASEALKGVRRSTEKEAFNKAGKTMAQRQADYSRKK